MPRLVVLLPCFNQRDRLEKTLAPLADDPTPFDLLLVDDGSTPPLTLPPTIGSHAVRVLRLEKNGGIENALNAGLEQILSESYEYVARLDAGDISLPGRFEAQLAYLDAHPECGLCGTACDWVDLEGKLLFTYTPPKTDRAIRMALRYNNVFCHPTMMIRVSVLREIGRYSKSFPAAEDYELALRIAKYGQVANLGEVYLKCEANPAGISQQKRRRQVASRIKAELHYFDPGSIHSYLGVAANAAVMFVPQPILLRVKRLMTRVPV